MSRPGRIGKSVIRPVGEPEGYDSILQHIGDPRELGSQLVSVYRTEIHDYDHLPEGTIENDVLPNSIRLIDRLLSNVRSGVSTDPEFDQVLRDSAIRRFHQGVSIEGLLHSYRLWGRTVWREIENIVDRDDPTQVGAALQIAERIMEHVDHASGVVAQAYFAEVAGITSDRSILRGEMLDALLGARSVSQHIARRFKMLTRRFTGNHIVVVVTNIEHHTHETAGLRQLVERVRAQLERDPGDVTIGLRANELIAICPVPQSEDVAAFRDTCNELARQLDTSVIGIGRRHDGVQGVGTSYTEAAEATSIAKALGLAGRATSFREVLFDYLARSRELANGVVDDTITPLLEYDEKHNSALVTTLRIYYETRYSLTRSAELLYVHPNTVTYRLRRIREVTGLDPSTPDELLLLSMGLKFSQLIGLVS